MTKYQEDINKELYEDERISLFLQGKMTENEEKDFISDLHKDKELKTNAINQALIIKGLKQSEDELLNAFKQVSPQEINRLINRKIDFSKYLKRVSIAACFIVIIIGSFKGYDYYSTTRLGMKYAQAFPISEVIYRGENNTDVDQELATLFNNVIERKNLSETTEKLSVLWELSNQETYNDYTDYAPYIGWYLAIGYLEDYQKDKAKEILNYLIKEENLSLAFRTKIKILLDELCKK